MASVMRVFSFGVVDLYHAILSLWHRISWQVPVKPCRHRAGEHLITALRRTGARASFVRRRCTAKGSCRSADAAKRKTPNKLDPHRPVDALFRTLMTGVRKGMSEVLFKRLLRRLDCSFSCPPRTRKSEVTGSQFAWRQRAPKSRSGGPWARSLRRALIRSHWSADRCRADKKSSRN